METSSAKMISYLRILLVSLPFFAVADLFQAIFNRDLAFRAPAATSLASYVLGYGAVSLILATLGFGTYALVLAFVSQHVLRVCLLLVCLENRPRLAFSRPDARRILRFGFGFSIAKIGNVTALQADNLIVASYLGNAALGLYSRSYQIIMSPIGLLAMIVDRVLFPAMARQQNRIATLRSAFLMLNGAVFAIFLPLSLVLFEFRHELVLILLGGAWSAASGPFGMLGIGLSFRAGYRLSDIVARARGLVYRRAVVQWIYAGCIVTGGIAGARWGLTGVALGISAAIAVNWLLMTALTNRSLNITWAAVLASLRPTLFTSTLTFLAIVGLNLMLGRAASISLHSSVSSTLVVAAALIASLTLRSAKVALGDWQQILRRAKRAG
jgi:PST family polysaccharide transporter